MSGAGDYGSVDLPEFTVFRIKRLVAPTGFGSVDGYIQVIMEQLLHQVAEGSEPVETRPADEQEVKNRLKLLGQLNG